MILIENHSQQGEYRKGYIAIWVFLYGIYGFPYMLRGLPDIYSLE